MLNQSMTSKLIIFSILIIFALPEVTAQNYYNEISGIIVDSKTKIPLENVNIYISNTTWGTTSGKEGKFTFPPIIQGNHEIVFSMIGYETASRFIKVESTSKIFIKVELVPRVYQTDEIIVAADRPDIWYDDLRKFKRKFLGLTYYSTDCIIKNEFFLNFSHPQKNLLVATSEYPLQIINHTLGYNIKCELEIFEYNEVNGVSRQSYKLFFTEIDTNDSDVQNKWKEKRKRIYKESLYFFLQALKSNQLSNENFEVSYKNLPHFEILSSQIIKESDVEDSFQISFENYLRIEKAQFNDENKISYIKLNYPYVTLDKYGYPKEENAFMVGGFWGELGVASFLPKYYNVSE